MYLINVHVSNACSVPDFVYIKTETVPAHKPLTFWLAGQAEKKDYYNPNITQAYHPVDSKKSWTLIILCSYCCPCKISFKWFWDTSWDLSHVVIGQSSGAKSLATPALLWSPLSLPTTPTKSAFYGNAKSSSGLEWGKQGEWPWKWMPPYSLLALMLSRCWNRNKTGSGKRSFSLAWSYIKSSEPWNSTANGCSLSSIGDTLSLRDF